VRTVHHSADRLYQISLVKDIILMGTRGVSNLVSKPNVDRSN
jgi:hypothetical protein